MDPYANQGGQGYQGDQTQDRGLFSHNTGSAPPAGYPAGNYPQGYPPQPQGSQGAGYGQQGGYNQASGPYPQQGVQYGQQSGSAYPTGYGAQHAYNTQSSYPSGYPPNSTTAQGTTAYGHPQGAQGTDERGLMSNLASGAVGAGVGAFAMHQYDSHHGGGHGAYGPGGKHKKDKKNKKDKSHKKDKHHGYRDGSGSSSSSDSD